MGRRKRIINEILERLVAVNIVCFLLMCTAIESKSLVPVVVMGINLAAAIICGVLRG
jgi:hypothetical protein